MELIGRSLGTVRTARAVEPPRGVDASRRGPWPRRVSAWIGERHGLPVLVMAAILYAVAVSGGADATSGATSGRLAAWQFALGGAAFWSWYLMLRVLDDLEDDPSDAIAHPERLLQRRFVSRGDLWALAAVSAAFQLVASLLLDLGTTTWTITTTWLALAAFLGAVALDFGAPTALAARPLLRRVLRLPASVLPLAWVYAIGTIQADQAVPAPVTGPVLALLATGFCTLAVVDVSRKFEPAQAGELSWPVRLGEARAYRLLTALVMALGACAAVLVVAADGRWSGTIAPTLCGVTLVGAALVGGRRDHGASVLYAALILAITLVSLVGGAA